MLFNSSEFLFLFLPVVLVIYYRLSHVNQNRFLLLASAVFYATWNWRFLPLLLLTAGIDYVMAARMQQSVARGEPKSQRRIFLLISLFANLGVLGFFKYYNFFATNVQESLAAIGFAVDVASLNVILPLGISFYTFQAMSYTIDVYRGELHASKSFGHFLLAVMYFPHLIAGPIQRASQLLPQIAHPRVIRKQEVIAGVHLIGWGLFKKIFIADNLAPIVNSTFAAESASGGAVLVATLAFAFQIYADFSAYSDIARGLAKIMGFEFTLNFNLPYLARNPSDFWQRWHISLSSWLRDYVYIPMGGNRGTQSRTYLNLFLTMLIGGLWHGAAWTFVIWGAYHGALLVGHRLVSPMLGRARPLLTIPSAASTAISVLVMFLFTLYGWLIFRAESVPQLVAMTTALSNPFADVPVEDLLVVASLILPLIVVQAAQYVTGRLGIETLLPRFLAARTICYSVLAYGTIFVGGQPSEFIYFQF